jgi:predicted anti-sigma-YlaC factor YlaD
MRCHAAQKLLSLQLDRRLDADGEASLSAHLASCEGCRAQRAAMLAGWEALAMGIPPGAPDDWRAISARLDRPRSRWLEWLSGLWLANPGRLASGVALATFLVAGIGAGSWLSRRLKPALPIEAVAMAEAFGDSAGDGWLVNLRGSDR